MISLCRLILFGSLIIPLYQSKVICMLEVKRSQKVPSERQVPRQILWTSTTPTGLSCAELCFQNSSCSFYAFQNRICHGYSSSGTGNSHGQRTVIVQGHIWKYKSKAVRDGYSHIVLGSTQLLVKTHSVWRTQNNAVRVCRREGATLIKLDTLEKNSLINRAIGIQNWRTETFWIGLSNKNENKTWKWTDGTDLSQYSNWADGNPGNKGNRRRHCASMWLKNRKWFSYPCTDFLKFICERN